MDLNGAAKKIASLSVDLKIAMCTHMNYFKYTCITFQSHKSLSKIQVFQQHMSGRLSKNPTFKCFPISSSVYPRLYTHIPHNTFKFWPKLNKNFNYNTQTNKPVNSIQTCTSHIYAYMYRNAEGYKHFNRRLETKAFWTPNAVNL